jgi:hypothetical protein
MTLEEKAESTRRVQSALSSERVKARDMNTKYIRLLMIHPPVPGLPDLPEICRTWLLSSDKWPTRHQENLRAAHGDGNICPAGARNIAAFLPGFFECVAGDLGHTFADIRQNLP